MLLEATTFLGPARVTKVAGAGVMIALREAEVSAVLAVAYPYRPVEGDLVLAIGQESNYYVIGVIQGKGKSVFLVPGDLEFQAPRGRIDLLAGKGVRIQGPEVSVKAGKLEMTAKSMTERFGDAYRWVRGVFQFRAKRARHLVEEKYSIKAGRIVERAEQDVRIDGKKINLG